MAKGRRTLGFYLGSIWAKMFYVTTLVTVVITLIEGSHYFSPFIDVFPEAPLSAKCLIADVQYVSGSHLYNLAAVRPSRDRSGLLPGERSSVSCSNGFDTLGPVRAAEVLLVVTYTPAFAWRKHSKTSSFDTVIQSDGMARWEPKGTS